MYDDVLFHGHSAAWKRWMAMDGVLGAGVVGSFQVSRLGVELCSYLHLLFDIWYICILIIYDILDMLYKYYVTVILYHTASRIEGGSPHDFDLACSCACQSLIIHDKTRFDLLLGRYLVRHTDIVMLCLLGPVASIFARNVVELIEIFLLIVTCRYCDWSLWPSFGIKTNWIWIDHCSLSVEKKA